MAVPQDPSLEALQEGYLLPGLEEEAALESDSSGPQLGESLLDSGSIDSELLVAVDTPEAEIEGEVSENLLSDSPHDPIIDGGSPPQESSSLQSSGINWLIDDLSGEISLVGDSLGQALALDANDAGELTATVQAGEVIVLAPLTAAGVTVALGEGDDALTVSSELINALGAVGGSLHFDGGLGTDTLFGPGMDSLWTVTALNQGNVNTVVQFSGVEKLTGGTDNEDTFVFEQQGAISGGIDGGDGGFDSLVFVGESYTNVGFEASGPHSGSVTLDGQTVNYEGLEPITLNSAVATLTIDADLIAANSAGNAGSNENPQTVAPAAALADTLILEDDSTNTSDLVLRNDPDVSPTIETIYFVKPTTELIIDLGGADDVLEIATADIDAKLTIRGGAGTDSVVLTGTVDLEGNNLEIHAERINVATGASLSGLGSVLFNAIAEESNQITNAANVSNLQASINIAGDINATGNVTASATVKRDINISTPLPIDLTADSSASVHVDGGSITATTFSLSATTQGKVRSASTISTVNRFTESAVASIKNSTNTINVGGLSIDATTQTNYSAFAVSALNEIDGDVKASIEGSSVNAGAGGVSVAANDLAMLTAAAPEQIVNLDSVVLPVSVNVASAQNLLDRNVEAFITNSALEATGADITIEATKQAQLGAQAKTTSVAASLPFTGSISIGGTYSSNTLIGSTTAYIENDSDIKTLTSGDVLVRAEDTSGVDAKSGASATSQTPEISLGGTGFSLGASVAFNSIGWRVVPGIQTLDALLGPGPGSFERSDVSAYIIDSSVVSAQDVLLSADAKSKFNATVSNAAASTADSIFGASSVGSGGIFASNKINSGAFAYIADQDTDDSITTDVNAVRNAIVRATDESGIYSNSKIVSSSTTTNDGGASVLQESINDLLEVDHTSDATSVTLEFGDRVRLADDYAVPTHSTTPQLGLSTNEQGLIDGMVVEVTEEATGDGTVGSVYQYVGEEQDPPTVVDLVTLDYGSSLDWVEISGSAGSVYEFMGADGIDPASGLAGSSDLSRLNYSDLGYWKEVPES